MNVTSVRKVKKANLDLKDCQEFRAHEDHQAQSVTQERGVRMAKQEYQVYQEKRVCQARLECQELKVTKVKQHMPFQDLQVPRVRQVAEVFQVFRDLKESQVSQDDLAFKVYQASRVNQDSMAGQDWMALMVKRESLDCVYQVNLVNLETLGSKEKRDHLVFLVQMLKQVIFVT